MKKELTVELMVNKLKEEEATLWKLFKDARENKMYSMADTYRKQHIILMSLLDEFEIER